MSPECRREHQQRHNASYGDAPQASGTAHVGQQENVRCGQPSRSRFADGQRSLKRKCSIERIWRGHVPATLADANLYVAANPAKCPAFTCALAHALPILCNCSMLLTASNCRTVPGLQSRKPSASKPARVNTGL